MFLVDTNILLHGVNLDSPEHEQARRSLESFANGSERWFVSWGILYEYLRVATHRAVFKRPLTFGEAYGSIASLAGSPSCSILTETEVHRETLERSARETHRLSGNLLHDFHIAVLMREHGIEEIVTRDDDFKAFPWVRIRPLS